jgi:hypothetical protein
VNVAALATSFCAQCLEAERDLKLEGGLNFSWRTPGFWR